MSKLVISEDLREMYDLPFGDNSRAFPFSTARALIERISRAEATLASRNSTLDRLNASNERLTAENDALKLRLQRMCEPVSIRESEDAYGKAEDFARLDWHLEHCEYATVIIAARAAALEGK